MISSCTSCLTTNRSVACYCKKCGTRLSAGKTDGLDDLVGMDDVKKVMNELVSVMAAIKTDGLSYSGRLHTVLMGNTGTGKTKLVNILASLYNKYGITKHDTPIIYDAVDFADFSKNFQNNYKKAKGNILCIENVHQLIPVGEDQSVVQLDRIFREMEKNENKYDPIIILSGHLRGLREYLNKNIAVKGRFRVFPIPDFDSEQLTQLTEAELVRNGFSLSDDTRGKLANAYKYILKLDRMPDAEPEAKNAWLAQKMVERIQSSYWLRVAKAGQCERVILPDDIKGDVENEKTLDQVLAELDRFTGMHGIKAAVRGLIDEIEQTKMLEDLDGKVQKLPEFHVTLTGNPGTGKTVIARKLGEIFKAIGLLELGHVIEVGRDKLVAGYLGQTAIKVNALCDRAMGGVLFIDEAYMLKQKDDDTWGQEAIDTLLARMENDRGKFIVVVAGYRDKMNIFMRSNDGLHSRFKEEYRFHIDDYNAEELLAIFKNLATEENNQLDNQAEELLKKQFVEIYSNRDKSFGNARDVRNRFDACKKQRSNRLKYLIKQQNFDKSEMKCIRLEDIPITKSGNYDVDTVLHELDKMIGLDTIKKEIRSLISYLEVEKKRAEQGGKETKLNLHFIFRGNAGTGKTTVARIVAEIFKAMGLLSKGHLKEVTRADLVAGHVGQTSPKVNGVIDEAMGGVLFIDEAYSLVGDVFGDQAIVELLKRMDDDRGKFIVIAAGYSKEMEDFLSSNSGLTSRFTKFIDFEDYDPSEMKAIYKFMLSDKGMILDSQAEQRVESLLGAIYENRDRSFANGRTVRNIFERSLQNQSARIAPLVKAGSDMPDILNTITTADITV